MFVTPGPEKTSNHGLQECRWCNQEFSKHQTSKHRNKEWTPILWQIELVLQIDKIACATSLQQPQRQDTAILKGLMSLGLPLGFNHWPSQPGETNQKAARHCPKKILGTVPSTPLVWLSRRVIGFSDPKEWEIVPIDSPSSGCPVGKITSHLHQIQDYNVGPSHQLLRLSQKEALVQWLDGHSLAPMCANFLSIKNVATEHAPGVSCRMLHLGGWRKHHESYMSKYTI